MTLLDCVLLIIEGSRSSLGNKLQYYAVCLTLRFKLSEYKLDFDVGIEAKYEEKIAGNIRDLLSLRYSATLTLSSLN